MASGSIRRKGVADVLDQLQGRKGGILGCTFRRSNSVLRDVKVKALPGVGGAVSGTALKAMRRYACAEVSAGAGGYGLKLGEANVMVGTDGVDRHSQ
ncbi:hypothetical protein KCP74_25625 (plasmid) [Salmonella enterica subsp. enterica]|nr:hypothetical protein KCP74_25625 [Salmonella enterica subsp. enterica]